MPTINLATLELSYGKSIGTRMIPAAEVLQWEGPSITIEVGLHKSLIETRKKTGDTIPSPISCKALIDTGATVTTLDMNLAKALTLNQTGDVSGIGIGGHSKGFKTSCCIDIKGLRVNLARAHCHDMSHLGPSGPKVLIGRDILRFMRMEYDGMRGAIRLGIPTQQKAGKPQKKKK